MNCNDWLVGQAFTRGGIRYTVAKCHGSTVLAAVLRGGRVERVLVPLTDVLASLEVAEVTVTELPPDESAATGS
jgi:hypothetical protein